VRKERFCFFVLYLTSIHSFTRCLFYFIMAREKKETERGAPKGKGEKRERPRKRFSICKRKKPEREKIIQKKRDLFVSFYYASRFLSRIIEGQTKKKHTTLFWIKKEQKNSKGKSPAGRRRRRPRADQRLFLHRKQREAAHGPHHRLFRFLDPSQQPQR
jgi:hypothetical protein